MFARITPCMENGKIAIARNLTNGIGAGSTEYHVIRARESIEPTFVLHYLMQERIRRDARSVMQGAAGQLRVPASFLCRLLVPLPPQAEQWRIVAEVETQFTRIDAADRAILRARTKAGAHTGLVFESAIADAPRFAFQYVLAAPLSNGRSVPTAKVGFPVLRLTAIRQGRVDLSQYKIGNFEANDPTRFLVTQGDILIVRGNGSLSLVGRAGLVGATPVPIAFPDTLIRARLNTTLALPEYIARVWQTRATRLQIQATARTSAGIYKINQGDIEKIQLPLPSRDEQMRIMSRAGRLEDLALQSQLAMEKAGRLATRLRQSILKTAFEGKLVPQDPHDEPASVLLERIRATRLSPRSRARAIR